MATVDSSSGANAFASANSDVQARRIQVAQFAILRAATHLSESNQDEAIKEFKNALVFDPQNETAHTYLGKIYQSQGKIAEAIKEFKQVIQNDRTSVTARNNLGNAYLQDKQYANAEQEFKYAARMDPTDPLADYTLGNIYTQTDRFSEAEAQFIKVAKVSPNDANVPYSFGVLYNKMARPEAAAQQLEKALSLKKDFPAANYELGAAYLKMGETDKADAQLNILLTKDAGLANDLLFLRDTPKIAYMEDTNNENFNSGLGARTPLWMLDPTRLSTPNSSIRAAVAIQFTNEMDAASVMNPANWEISRADGSEGGYYNSSMPASANEVSIPKRPFSVTYDPVTRQAKIFFILNQNGSIDIGNGNAGATIDPSHLVFKFSGIDAAGRQMDTTGDQIDGYSIRAY
jgi:tetratricopeptide (TPR) repeat protein